MKTKLFLNCAMFALFALSQSAFGQISFTSVIPPSTSPLEVCNIPRNFSVTVTNNGGSSATACQLSINFPDGIIYGGTVSGATYVGGSDPAIFNVANIPSGGAVTVNYNASATCDRINEPVNANDFSFSCNLGTFTHTTASYNVSYAAFVITNVTNQYFTGTPGQNYNRVITIFNGGFGSVQELKLETTNTNGLAITGVSGGGASPSPALPASNVVYTINNFTGVGDGDNFFEQNESINITETVQIPNPIGCSSGTTTSNTEYAAYYGCNGSARCPITNSTDIAGYYSGTAAWSATNSLASLQITADYVSPSPCLEDDINYRVVVRNNGTNTATAGFFRLSGRSQYMQYLTNMVITGGGTTTVTYDPVDAWVEANFWNNTIPDPNAGIVANINFSAIAAGDSMVINVKGVRNSFNHCIQYEQFYYGLDYNNFAYWNGCNMDGLSDQGGLGVNYAAGDDAGIYGNIYSIDYPYIVADNEKIRICYGMNLRVPHHDNTGYVTYWVKMPTGVYFDPTDLGSVVFTTENYPGNEWYASSYTLSGDTVKFRFNMNTMPAIYHTQNVSRTFCYTLSGQAGVGCLAESAQQQYFSGGKIVTSSSCSSYFNLCGEALDTDFWIERACMTATCEGLNPVYFDVKRISYSLPDPNNDNRYDGTGTINPAQLRLKDVIQGDTLAGVWKGIVLNPNGATNWTTGAIAINLGNFDFTDWNILRGEPQIWDASAGVYLTLNCSNIVPSQFLDAPSSPRKVYYYDLSSCIPAGFTFNTGDSVILRTKWQHTVNRDDGWLSLGIRNKAYVGNSVTPSASYNWWVSAANEYGCNRNVPDYYMIHPHNIEGGADNSSASGCAIGNVITKFRWHTRSVAEELFWSNEVRHIAYPTSVNMALPAGATFDHAELRFHLYNDGGEIIIDPNFAPASTYPGGVIFNVKPEYFSQGGQISENEQRWVTIIAFYKGACTNAGSQTLPVIYNFEMAQPIASIAPTKTEVFTYTYSPPSSAVVGFYLPNTNYCWAYNDTAYWVVNVFNGASDPLDNVWIAPKSGINGVDIVSVTPVFCGGGTTPNGNPILTPNAAGIYELGTISSSAQCLLIKALFSNCIKDSIQIMAGYSCSGYPTDISNPAIICNKIEETLYVSPQTTSIQQIITVDAANTNPHQLCDTLDYEIAVANVQSGYIRHIKTFFVMSPSTAVNIIPGTSRVEYPSGSGTWYTLQDPVLNGSTYSWAISDDPVAAGTNFANEGLPSATSAPQNQFKLKFRAVSVACAFKSGVTFLFTTEGTKPCGEKIYATDQITQPVEIPGAATPHNTYNVKLMNDDAAPCNNQTATVRFSAKNNGPFISSATEFIDFIVYNGASVSGTLTPIHNAPTGAPTAINAPGGTIYRYTMPTGVFVNDSIVFTLPVQVNQNLSCDTSRVRIEANTNISFNATCITNGQICSLGQITGQDNDNYINVTRTSLSLSALTAWTSLNPPSGETLHASVVVTNAGTTTITNANPITVQFYKDADLNGSVNAGDVLLGSQTQSVNLAPSSSITVNFNQNVAAGTACPLLVTILETPCYCNRPMVATTNVIVEPDSISISTCPGVVTAPIGTAPITGYSYNWVAVTPGANAYLNATNIPNPTFSKPTNTSGSVEYITYNLYIDRGTACIGVQTVVIEVDIPANCPQNYGSIGNYVWQDTDGNGLQNESVANGLNGVTVQLYVVGADGLIGTADDTLKQTVLTANNGGNPGYYLFDSLYTSSYYVHFPITANGGAALTTPNTSTTTDGNSDASVTTGNSVAISINTNGSGIIKDNMTIDAGYQCNLTASIVKSNDLSCPIPIATLTANPSTGATYLWSNGATSASIVVSTAGTYSVTITSLANSCSGNANVTVTSTISVPPCVPITVQKTK